MRTLFFICVFLISQNNFAQTHNLPSLKYSYSEYEPFIDAQTMEIHHSKHHQAYVNNLNKSIAGTNMEKSSLIELMMYASFRPESVRNNAGGHYNHTFFWEILTPEEKQTKNISKELDAAIITHFGHLDSLKAKLNQAASLRFGSGWAWLLLTPQKN